MLNQLNRRSFNTLILDHGPRFGQLLLVLFDTTILIVDTYVKIPVLPRSRYIAIYRSSEKYRETAQVL